MTEPERDGLPTGENTAVQNDVTDPHPSTEQHADHIEHSRGVHRPAGPDIGPNNAVHDGTPQPRPDNAETIPLNRALSEDKP